MVNKKIGRPTSDNPKNARRITVRLDKETLGKLDECVESLVETPSQVIREGIEEIHQSLGRINRKK